MNNTMKPLALLLSVLCNNGCAGTLDRALAPPSDTQWVNVEVKNPSPYTKPFPLEVVYISHKCMKSSINGVDGSREEKPAYNGAKVPLQRQGNSDVWRAKVAMNGGGSCEWKLSEFNLGIEYIDATHLGKDLVPGTAVGATIAFDDSAAQDGKFDHVVDNKLNYNPKYYPFIKRWSGTKNSSESDKLYLFGKESSFWNVYINSNPKKNIVIEFTPSIDEKKIIEIKFPYKKTKGAMFELLYPNGDNVKTKNANPDFEKVDKMEVK